MSGVSVFAATFGDVPEDHKNYEAIEYLHEQGIINGYEDGNFGPEDPVTRAQTTKIIGIPFNVSNSGNYQEVFPDVTQEAWYFAYVMGAKQAGIIQGYEDGTFKPEQGVSLAEALKISLVAANINLEEAQKNVFVDVLANDWFAPHFLYAKDMNLVLADEDGKVTPNKQLSRGELAELIYRLIKVKESGEAFDVTKNWLLFESQNLPFRISYPGEDWKIIDGEICYLYYPNAEVFQFAPVKIHNNSARFAFALDKNESNLDKTQYFNNIKSTFAGAQFKEFSLNGHQSLEVLYPEQKTIDWYVYVSRNEILAVYMQYGDGDKSYYFQQVFKAMINSFAYQEVRPIDKEGILSAIFENTLKENVGMEMLNLLPDKLIIETDTIGVGTGAVDYYYCEEFDYTFKYERASDLILDSREGRTSAF